MSSPPDFTCPNGHRIPEQRFHAAIGCVVTGCTYRISAHAAGQAEPFVGFAFDRDPVEPDEPPAEDPPARESSEAADKLRRYVSCWENLIDARKAIADDLRELRNQADSDGFPAKALAELIRRRAMAPKLRECLDSLVPLYEEIVGPDAGVIDGGTIGRLALPPPTAASTTRAARASREIMSAELARQARQDGF